MLVETPRGLCEWSNPSCWSQQSGRRYRPPNITTRAFGFRR